jgi:hypothetical protein
MTISEKDTTDETKGKPLTREQKRMVDRINAAAAETIELLTSQFLNAIMAADDPEGPEVGEKIKQIDAKWRMYCKRKGLAATAYTIMDNYMTTAIKEYYDEKEHKKKVETELKPEHI